jgi:hypothetical protein
MNLINKSADSIKYTSEETILDFLSIIKVEMMDYFANMSQDQI